MHWFGCGQYKKQQEQEAADDEARQLTDFHVCAYSYLKKILYFVQVHNILRCIQNLRFLHLFEKWLNPACRIIQYSLSLTLFFLWEWGARDAAVFCFGFAQDDSFCVL